MSDPSSDASRADTVILVVDDDPSIQRVTQRILANEGYTVLEAATAEEAERISDSHEAGIDVLIMDINLPDGWGASVAHRLRSGHPEMAVVYMTGFASTDPILSGALEGAPWVLLKPFRGPQLVDIVERALAGRSPTDPPESD